MFIIYSKSACKPYTDDRKDKEIFLGLIILKANHKTNKWAFILILWLIDRSEFNKLKISSPCITRVFHSFGCVYLHTFNGWYYMITIYIYIRTLDDPDRALLRIFWNIIENRHLLHHKHLLASLLPLIITNYWPMRHLLQTNFRFTRKPKLVPLTIYHSFPSNISVK